MIREIVAYSTLLLAGATTAQPCFSQSNPSLEVFFRQNVGLSQGQIAAILSGQPVAKTLPSRTPDEVFLFGAVFIHAAPEAYAELSRNVEHRRKVPGFLALGVFKEHPQLSDLRDFAFDNDDIQALRNCKTGDCEVQIPASSMEELRRSIDWSAPDVNSQVNESARKRALQLLLAYQHDGNESLGVYTDKLNPVEVQQRFASILGYSKILPEVLPDFHRYLLDYPMARPANVEDLFYWSKVKFGLKPTLRFVHVVIMKREAADEVAYAVAEKQLYASHYFETALDLSFCIRGGDPEHPGFYLVTILGSQQAGLTGVKGSIVRKVASDRSVSGLKQGLANIKNTLEDH